ncbi:MAG: acyl-CoA thioesterase [Candidatus Hodarchaeales archaeon]|jgi:acyl-CoA thioester hydrolase
MDVIDDYSVVVNIPVVWGDMDSFGHINNTKFFRYFETARIKYFECIGFIQEMKDSKIGPILASTSAKFIKPLFYPDTVKVGTRVSSLESTKFTMDYLILSEKSGTTAVGEAVIVVLNYATSTKSPLPVKVKEKILALEPALSE